MKTVHNSLCFCLLGLWVVTEMPFNAQQFLDELIGKKPSAVQRIEQSIKAGIPGALQKELHDIAPAAFDNSNSAPLEISIGGDKLPVGGAPYLIPTSGQGLLFKRNGSQAATRLLVRLSNGDGQSTYLMRPGDKILTPFSRAEVTPNSVRDSVSSFQDGTNNWASEPIGRANFVVLRRPELQYDESAYNSNLSDSDPLLIYSLANVASASINAIGGNGNPNCYNYRRFLFQFVPDLTGGKVMDALTLYLYVNNRVIKSYSVVGDTVNSAVAFEVPDLIAVPNNTGAVIKDQNNPSLGFMWKGAGASTLTNMLAVGVWGIE